MLTQVKLKYFKRFEEEVFFLGNTVVLAGPNNSGKTTLLQAISVWNLVVQKWLAEHTESSKAQQRTGVPISRKDFTAVPLREMNLLWFGRDTAYGKSERAGLKGGEPKLVAITLCGRDGQGPEWNLTVTLRYSNKELVHAKLTDESLNPITEVPESAKSLRIVHVPPFSGIGAEETGLQAGYQNLLVGQGKPGDILRNLLLEVFKNSEKNGKNSWDLLKQQVEELFSYELSDPMYAEATDPFIRIEYQDKKTGSRKKFDIASAGSGFHQVLTLLGFFYARPASILLLDEPDAHLHVILQREIYDRLKNVARQWGCQLLISTHSEVLLEDTGADQILSFYGSPHRLSIDAHRDQVREALRRLSSLDILSAESGQNILYVEDETDYKILQAFSEVLHHPSRSFFKNPFFHPIRGNKAGEAKGHFFALKAIQPKIKGVLLLDGDNRFLPEHEVSADNLTILRWRRYEIENYLLHPEALRRFVAGGQPDLLSMSDAASAEQFLRDELPPAALKDPLGDHDYLESTPASKSLLPALFKKLGLSIFKKDYFQIAQQMNVDEIHQEIIEKLDHLAAALDIS